MNPQATPTWARWALVNFLVLAIAGEVLRYMHVWPAAAINYMFLLHAHSHFAFDGWMFFAIALLVAHQLKDKVPARALRYVFIFGLISAYGMLVSFYLQGYKAVSIAFSTLFIIVTYRFTWLVFKNGALRNVVGPLSYRLIRGALFYLCLSSLGPFSLAPIIAAGLRNSPVYQDAIYFYLHFQMNGFMLLAVLGLLAQHVHQNVSYKNSRLWLRLFIVSAVPLYFIFTLWSGPALVIRVIAVAGAGLNLAGWLALCINYRRSWAAFSPMARAAIAGITLKVVFQVLVCLPAIGSWAFGSRDLVIGYIHLLTLGIVTPLIFDLMLQQRLLKLPNIFAVSLYLGATVVYLVLLFLQPLLALFGTTIPGYEVWLFVVCFCFPAAAVLFLGAAGNPPGTFVKRK